MPILGFEKIKSKNVPNVNDKNICIFIGFVCDFIDFLCEFTVKTTEHTLASYESHSKTPSNPVT
jgi:hypothetical protein